MNASNTDDLSIAQAIDTLEARLAEIRKGMPWYKEFFMIVPEGGDLELLSDFIADVNSDLEMEALAREHLVALDANGIKEWFAMMKGAIPFSSLWVGIKRVCGAGRCSLKIRVGESEIDVSAASAEDAERLMKCASRMIITKNNTTAKARLENRP